MFFTVSDISAMNLAKLKNWSRLNISWKLIKLLRRFVIKCPTSLHTYYQIKLWSKQFKWRKGSIEDDPRSRYSAEDSGQEICDKEEAMVMEESCIKVFSSAHKLGVSVGTVFHIIHKKWLISTVSSCWVPRLMTPDHKGHQDDSYNHNLVHFKQDLYTEVSDR